MQNKLFTFQVLGVIAFALVLSHEDSSLFSHYGFFIVVSALCWIGALLIIFFHVIGCCKVKILGIWQREYSLVRDICSFNELCLRLLFLFYTDTVKFSYMYKLYTVKLVKLYIILQLDRVKIILEELIFTRIMSLSKLKKSIHTNLQFL